MESWKETILSRYREQNKTAQSGQIVCAGSSLMERFPIDDLLQETGSKTTIYNRGVSGFVMEELFAALDVCILDLKPARLFINIGTNNLNDPDCSMEELMAQYSRLLTQIETELPQIEIYLMAYYPVNPAVATSETRECLQARTNRRIEQANEGVHALARQHDVKYIDLNGRLKDESGCLKLEFTDEGMHLNERAYRAIFPDFMRYADEPQWKRK